MNLTKKVKTASIVLLVGYFLFAPSGRKEEEIAKRRLGPFSASVDALRIKDEDVLELIKEIVKEKNRLTYKINKEDYQKKHNLENKLEEDVIKVLSSFYTLSEKEQIKKKADLIHSINHLLQYVKKQ